MQITPETPRTEIQIQGVTFTVPVPYAEGHVLAANEASALNQQLTENLRNNFANKVREAKERGEDPSVLQSALDEYAAAYEFGARRSGGGGGGLPADPVERETIKLAREAVREHAKKKGVKLEAEAVNRLAGELVQKDDRFRKAAKKRVDEMNRLAIDDIDIGGQEQAEAA